MKKEEFDLQKRIIAKKVKNKLNLNKTSEENDDDEDNLVKSVAKSIHDSLKFSLTHDLKDAIDHLEKASKGEEFQDKKIYDFFWACKNLMEEIEKEGLGDWVPND